MEIDAPQLYDHLLFSEPGVNATGTVNVLSEDKVEDEQIDDNREVNPTTVVSSGDKTALDAGPLVNLRRRPCKLTTLEWQEAFANCQAKKTSAVRGIGEFDFTASVMRKFAAWHGFHLFAATQA